MELDFMTPELPVKSTEPSENADVGTENIEIVSDMDDIESESNDDVLPVIQLELSDEDCGIRLDKVLSRLVPQYSRSRIQQWIDAGYVTIDGIPVRGKATTIGDEQVTLRPQAAPDELAFLPEPMTLNIVHEDDAILVLDKAAGIVVHPAAGNWLASRRKDSTTASNSRP